MNPAAEQTIATRRGLPTRPRRELVNEGLAVSFAHDLSALGASTPDACSKTVDGMVRDLCAKFRPDARYWQAGPDNPATAQYGSLSAKEWTDGPR